MSLDEYLAQLLDAGRGVGQNALATVTDPVGHLRNSLTRYAQENLPTRAEMDDARSVMPGMGDAARGKINALAMNALGAGIFAGRGAKTADLLAMKRAQMMQEHGAPRDYIWQKTGWFQGPEGAWKFEIPDDLSRMRLPIFGNEAQPASDVMKHESLSRAYPSLLDDIMTKVEWNQMRGGGYGKNGQMVVRGPTVEDARNVMLHELQHAIQGREGFARGGNRSVDSEYNRLAGEAEARAVQNRMYLSPVERRQIPPWQSHDVPMEEQLVAY